MKAKAFIVKAKSNNSAKELVLEKSQGPGCVIDCTLTFSVQENNISVHLILVFTDRIMTTFIYEENKK